MVFETYVIAAISRKERKELVAMVEILNSMLKIAEPLQKLLRVLWAFFAIFVLFAGTALAKASKESLKKKPKYCPLKINKTIFIALALALGCQSRDVRPKGTGTEYFPLKVGAYWIYDVLSTSITQLGGQTTSSYELKMVIADSIVSPDNVSYVIQRFKRRNSTETFTSMDTWSARRDQFQAIVQEGNTPYLKLAFPLSEGKTWNGNSLNDIGGTDRCADGKFNCDNYVVKDWKKRFEANNVSFENSVTILENNDRDPIVRQDVRTSVYANAVGLVYKEIIILDYCTVGTCIGQQIVDHGIIFKQTLKDYGGL